jgi:hypothetical protein
MSSCTTASHEDTMPPVHGSDLMPVLDVLRDRRNVFHAKPFLAEPPCMALLGAKDAVKRTVTPRTPPVKDEDCRYVANSRPFRRCTEGDCDWELDANRFAKDLRNRLSQYLMGFRATRRPTLPVISGLCKPPVISGLCKPTATVPNWTLKESRGRQRFELLHRPLPCRRPSFIWAREASPCPCTRAASG